MHGAIRPALSRRHIVNAPGSPLKLIRLTYLLTVLWALAVSSSARAGDVSELLSRSALRSATAPVTVGARQGGREAERVSEPLRRVGETVERLISRNATSAELRAASTDLVRVNDAGEIQVYVVLAEFKPEYVAQLGAGGLHVELTLPEFRLVQGWVPASLLESIARYDFVREVKPPGYPVQR